MKLYDFSLAPNPRRVRMFIAEKGIEVPTVQINTREAEQFSEEFIKINPRSTVPALQLDDGTVLTESVSICRYFEETHPEPPLMGRTATEKAVIDMWNRRAEIEFYLPAADVVRNSLDMFKDRGLPGMRNGVPQIPALAERGRATFARFIERTDAHLANNRFLAGDGFSIADMTTFIAADFAKRGELEIPAQCTNMLRWQSEIAARPSASA